MADTKTHSQNPVLRVKLHPMQHHHPPPIMPFLVITHKSPMSLMKQQHHHHHQQQQLPQWLHEQCHFTSQMSQRSNHPPMTQFIMYSLIPMLTKPNSLNPQLPRSELISLPIISYLYIYTIWHPNIQSMIYCQFACIMWFLRMMQVLVFATKDQERAW